MIAVHVSSCKLFSTYVENNRYSENSSGSLQAFCATDLPLAQAHARRGSGRGWVRRERGPRCGHGIKEIGLRFPVSPLFDMVAGPGFEPGAFGERTRQSPAAIRARTLG